MTSGRTDTDDYSATSGTWLDRYMPQAGFVEPEGTAGITLAALRGFAWRQRYILIGVTAAALIFGFIATLLTTPMYKATATVRLSSNMQSIVEGQDLVNPILENRDLFQFGNTLATVAKSRAVALQVVDALRLDQREAVAGKAAEKPEAMSAQEWRNARRGAAAESLRGAVTLDVPGDSNVLSLNFMSPNARLAAEIANAYAEALIADDMRRGLAANSYALEYLQGQIAQTRTKLEEAERQAIGYARANRILGGAMAEGSPADGNSNSASNPTVVGSSLASVNQTYIAARAERIRAEQKWLAAASVPALQLPEVQQSVTIQAMIASRATQRARLADLETRYGSEYPGVREARAELAALNSQIAAASSDVKDSLRRAHQAALRQEQALEAELARVSEASLDEQDRRVQLNQMDRETGSLRQQLQSLLERYNQISSAANVQQGTITKLDPATVPVKPISPVLFKNMLVAFVLGAAAAAGLAILMEFFDDRLRSADDVKAKLKLPLLGQTPFLDEDSVDQERQLQEAYASMRTSIHFALPKPDHNVLLFTSSQSGEGKTTTAVAFAQNTAQIGKRVLLVEADLRKPSMASHFDQSRSSNGFVEVLLNRCSLESALLSQPQANLDVLPVGTIPSNPVDVLSSPLINEFVNKYAPLYSLIIFDLPPVMGLADAPLMARVADGVVFIVEANRAHFGQAKAAIRRLHEADVAILGVVLSKFKALNAGLNHNYQYSYYSYGEGARN